MTPTTTLHRAAFADLPAFSALFARYCTDYERLAEYYAGDWQSTAARKAASDRAADFDRDRDVLVDVLLDQNERWGMDEHTRTHIEALRDPEVVAVVTGQQVGLLTGPLYTPYKTITTLQLARQMAEETGRMVVPVFWLEGGDHDLDEIAGIRMLRHNEVVDVRYTGHALPENGNLGPVGRLALTAQIEDVLAEVEAALPPSDFHDDLMAAVRDAYRPGTTLLDAFARLMRTLFPDAGLVFIDPDDTRLKQLAAPLFRREIEDYETSSARLSEVSSKLAADFHAQVNARATNLFLLIDEGRYAVEPDGNDFRLRGFDRRYSQDELLALLDAEPERFSPNVVLRPLMQDLLLPTAAYVAGPGEVAYFAQFKSVYAWACVPMPVVYPRASVSLVEGKVQKVLDKYALAIGDLGADLDQLFQRVVLEAMDVDTLFKEATRHLHTAVNELKPGVEKVDRTLMKAAEALRASLMKETQAFKSRVVRAEKQNQEAVRSQLEKAQINLYPSGTPQERALPVLYFMNKYGTVLTQLEHDLSLDTSAHQIVEL